MHIEKSYYTKPAESLLRRSPLARKAFEEIEKSINNMIGEINISEKHCNGVAYIKEGCYQTLEEQFEWYREKPLISFSDKGGPIDVYKEFFIDNVFLLAGLEFETGNISSAHRSMNKLAIGLKCEELNLAFLIMPVHELSYYLTDRVSNYEELAPYFSLVDEYPFIFLGFNAECYDVSFPLLPKGRDGMSHRSIHKWRDKYPLD